MCQAQPTCGWRAVLWHASSPRLYHTSYPVRVPRPTRSFHASFRQHRTVTRWRFPCPSAPRTPGQKTCTPKHDRMHGTHAQHQPRPKAVGCIPKSDGPLTLSSMRFRDGLTAAQDVALHLRTPGVITMGQNARVSTRVREPAVGGNASRARAAQTMQGFESCGGTGSWVGQTPYEP
jgi:hypothetical protein